jgi:hypothetical protein
MGQLTMNDFAHGGSSRRRVAYPGLFPVQAPAKVYPGFPMPGYEQARGGWLTDMYKRRKRRMRRPAPPGLGAVTGSPSKYLERCFPNYKPDASRRLQELTAQFEAAGSALSSAEGTLSSLKQALQQLGVNYYTDLEASEFEQSLRAADRDLSSMRASVSRAWDNLSYELKARFDANQCGLTPPHTDGAEWAGVFRAATEKAAAYDRNLPYDYADVERAVLTRRKRERELAEQEARRVEQERLQREEEDQRRQDELAAQQAAAQAAADAEAAAREKELEYQQMLAEEKRLEREQAWAREDAERARLAAAEQAKIDAEKYRYEMEVAAEERRAQLEQERILREEERALRQEEREAQMKQLMLLQEIAAKGLPTSMLPATATGMAPMAPMVPGAATAAYGMPISPAAPMIQSSMPAMTALPFQQAAPMPALPFQQAAPMPAAMPAATPAPPGYAATPPAAALSPFQQTAPMPAPSAPAPPGMTWASFDPGSEMFGMEGLEPLSSHPGAKIEEGYTLAGPDDNEQYLLIRPDGTPCHRFTMDFARSQGVVKDGNKIVFVPSHAGDDSNVEAEVARTIREAIKGTAQVLTERERRKAAEEGGGYGMFPTGGVPGLSITQKKKTGIPLWAWGVGALALGGIAIYVIVSQGDEEEEG